MPVEIDRGGRKFFWAAALAALASFIPFVRVFGSGQSFFFRDLAVYFLPTRRFLLDGLRIGEWRYWNPFLREGEPVSISPFGYLPDMLQLLIPNEFGISLFLALHIPFAAVAFTLLLRELGLTPVAACAGAIVYALGGFSLSAINLYIYVQAIAWAPLLVLTFRRAVDTGRPRAMVAFAVVLALTISSTGLEIAIQACILAVLITPPGDGRRLLRSAMAAGLGLGLAAAVVLPALSVLALSERGSGLTTETVLRYSIHPASLFQVVIAGFHGDPSNLTGRWWGQSFFPQGFPYFLSLYLGPTVLAFAAAGAFSGRPLARRIAVVAVAALFFGLGGYVGWQVFFDQFPALRFWRYPVKAFFTVQFSVAVLVAFAVSVLEKGAAVRHLSRLIAACLVLGSSLVASRLLLALAPTQTTAWFGMFLPAASFTAGQRAFVAHFVTQDAAVGGAVALVSGAIMILVSRGLFPAGRAMILVVALIGADLMRTGAGLNPGVTPEFFKLSPEMAHQVEVMRRSEGRVFTCDAEASASYWEGRAARGDRHEAFSLLTMQEALTPSFSVPLGLRTAMSPDSTNLAPPGRSLGLGMSDCTRFDLIEPLLRGAGVIRVLSLDALSSPSLRLLAEVAPEKIAPVRIHIYELSGALPRFNVPVRIVEDTPGQMLLQVEADRSTTFTVQEAFAEGWRATVNGAEQPILRTSSGNRAIALEAGRSEIRMRYTPPGLRTGLLITVLAAMICLAGLVFPETSHNTGASAFSARRRP